MTIWFVVGIAALTALAAPATAGAAGITYDCDTAANHYSELVLPAPSGPFTVTGSVRMIRTAESSEYLPIARVQIGAPSDPGKSAGAFAGFSLSALPAKEQMPNGANAVQMLSWNASGKEDEVLPLSMLTKPGTVQPFRLAYDGSKVSVSLGNEAKTLALRTGAPVVRIVCSTGEFLFTDVVIQRAV